MSGAGETAAQSRLTPWLALVPAMSPARERELAHLIGNAPLPRILGLLKAMPWWEAGWHRAIGECRDPAGRDRLRQIFHDIFPDPANALAACREAWRGGRRECAMRWLATLRSFDCSPRMLAKRARSEEARLRLAGRAAEADLYVKWLAALPDFEKNFFRPFASSACALLAELGQQMRPHDDWAYNIWHYGLALPRRESELAALPADLPGPAISILMPVFNPDPLHLAEALDSVLAQSWSAWELCIADDASTDPRIPALLRSYAARDERIHIVTRLRNGHISAASNTALGMASYGYCALLDQDDIISPDALAFMAMSIRRNPEARLFYSDEDMLLDESGALHGVYFKNGRFDAELLPQQNFVGHLALFRADLMRELGGFREGLEGSQDHDLWLRYAALCGPGQIVHVPHVLYHWRAHAMSTASGIGRKPYAAASAARAARDWLSGNFPGARCERLNDSPWQRITYPAPKSMPGIDLVCAWRQAPGQTPSENGDCGRLLAWLGSWLGESGRSAGIRILLSCRQEDEAAIRGAVSALGSLAGQILVLPVPAGMSPAQSLDYGARQGNGGLVGFVVPELAPERAGWAAEAAACLGRPGIGALGGKVATGDGSRLLHAGYLADGEGLKALLATGPARRGQWFGWNMLGRTVDAVDLACLFTSRENLEKAGGLRPEMAYWGGQDYCLRLGESGLKSLWWPYAEFRIRDAQGLAPLISEPPAAFTAAWRDQLRPFNPNLLISDPNFALKP